MCFKFIESKYDAQWYAQYINAMISDIVNIWQLEDIGIFIVLSIGWAIADAAESLGFFGTLNSHRSIGSQ